jgi:hypothetical protein
MKPAFCALFTLAAFGLAVGAAAEEKPTVTINFDGDPAGQPPPGFEFARTGSGAEGSWMVRADKDSPTNHVLVQESADPTDYRFPLAIVKDGSYRDVTLTVRARPISGKVDQGFGLVWRYKNANNYYLTRCNADEDNCTIYHVVDGHRRAFLNKGIKVPTNAWHTLKMEAKGDHFTVWFNGTQVLDVHDATFKDAGKVGLWTKADSVIQFEDLMVTDLGGSSATASGKIVGQVLVDELAARHPDLVRIGMHVTSPKGSANRIIASNIAEKIGQVSDPEDLKAMESGEPVVLKEKENMDVTLPLHDASGKVIGAIGLTFKLRAGEDQEDAIRRARAMAGEIEKQISSAARLFERGS